MAGSEWPLFAWRCAGGRNKLVTCDADDASTASTPRADMVTTTLSLRPELKLCEAAADRCGAHSVADAPGSLTAFDTTTCR
jgi:hypothetical protein